MEEIKELEIPDAIEPISIRSTEIILEQMKKCVCKIHKGETKGTGFFARIPYNNEFIKVLITNNHILNNNDIKEGNNIIISLNNDLISKNIKIDSRINIYTDKIFDITIIEISEEKDGIKDYLDINNEEININYYNNNATNIIGFVEVKINGISYHKEDIIQKDDELEDKISFWEKLKRKLASLW